MTASCGCFTTALKGICTSLYALSHLLQGLPQVTRDNLRLSGSSCRLCEDASSFWAVGMFGGSGLRVRSFQTAGQRREKLPGMTATCERQLKRNHKPPKPKTRNPRTLHPKPETPKP